MLTSLTDNNLWEAFCQRDRVAFSELFKRHYSLLYKYGLKVTPDKELLEDCIQELFLELWQMEKKTEVQSVKVYLIKALKYKLLKALKRKKLIINSEDKDDLPFELSYENLLIAKEDKDATLKKLSIALQQLTNRQREIVYLKYFQELSYEEAGEIMNLNYQVARNLLCQAVKSLKKLLADENL